MKAFLHITLAIASLALVACSQTKENMYRGAGVLAKIGHLEGGVIGDLSNAGIYEWTHTQFGGTAMWQNSMGSSSTVDNQVSFKDAMQAIAGVATSVYSFKAMAAAEVTKRLAEGELTKRQAQQLQFEISKILSEADVTKFLAGLAAAR